MRSFRVAMANVQIAAKSCLSSRKEFKLGLSTRQVNQAHLNQKTEDSQEKRVGRKQRNVKEKGIRAAPQSAEEIKALLCTSWKGENGSGLKDFYFTTLLPLLPSPLLPSPLLPSPLLQPRFSPLSCFLRSILEKAVAPQYSNKDYV